MSLRAFNKIPKDVESQRSEEINEIIKEKWSKATIEWKDILEESLTKIRPNMNMEEFIDLVNSCKERNIPPKNIVLITTRLKIDAFENANKFLISTL